MLRPQSQTAKRNKRKQDILSLDEDNDAYIPNTALMLEFDLAMSNDQDESNPPMTRRLPSARFTNAPPQLLTAHSSFDIAVCFSLFRRQLHTGHNDL
ncbi:hypothetical protein FNYG_09667 [Fusarium nygamai]|uniref:Uncharacterized protein n=1 Tax=Gibberella nygamai TaxID=42673 RepID=A0A2K0W444_GIBNY|nr:hypothetical protein FNYG_09667 [Fusarium nygamai]